uniref:Amino acid permease/ SLC12A domain-containing protein n=1 Tax=Angiostrongylus cantonensis TaxID=6313 RepID=A0A0K0D903_ANGCA
MPPKRYCRFCRRRRKRYCPSQEFRILQKMLRRLLREKLLTEKFLHHSELNRSLNIPFTVAIVCASSIPLLIFVLMPYSLTTLAGPSTILAVLLTFVIVLLSSAHLTELSCALPKSCVLYQFTFVMLGELPAFFGAWTTVLDSVCISTILCSSWSEHMNLLFRRSLHYYMSLPIPQRDSGMWVVNETYDFTALCAVFVTVIILSCNLRVVGTVSLCLVIVSVLMTTSCTMVGFFHADPQNWINASFFGFGFRGVLRAICALSCAYAGVDATSYLFDETKSPRKNLPVLLPTLVAFLSIFFFIITMIFRRFDTVPSPSNLFGVEKQQSSSIEPSRKLEEYRNESNEGNAGNGHNTSESGSRKISNCSINRPSNHYFSLSTDVSKLPQKILLPEMLSVLNIQAVKWVFLEISPRSKKRPVYSSDNRF